MVNEEKEFDTKETNEVIKTIQIDGNVVSIVILTFKTVSGYIKMSAFLFIFKNFIYEYFIYNILLLLPIFPMSLLLLLKFMTSYSLVLIATYVYISL